MQEYPNTKANTFVIAAIVPLVFQILVLCTIYFLSDQNLDYIYQELNKFTFSWPTIEDLRVAYGETEYRRSILIINCSLAFSVLLYLALSILFFRKFYLDGLKVSFNLAARTTFFGLCILGLFFILPGAYIAKGNLGFALTTNIFSVVFVAVISYALTFIFLLISSYVFSKITFFISSRG